MYKICLRTSQRGDLFALLLEHRHFTMCRVGHDACLVVGIGARPAQHQYSRRAAVASAARPLGAAFDRADTTGLRAAHRRRGLLRSIADTRNASVLTCHPAPFGADAASHVGGVRTLAVKAHRTAPGTASCSFGAAIAAAGAARRVTACQAVSKAQRAWTSKRASSRPRISNNGAVSN